MKIRTIIAATCLTVAISMAGPVAAHDGQGETVTKKFEATIPNIPHPREVGFHLRLCDLGRDRVEGE
jgi:hypothetical protein